MTATITTPGFYPNMPASVYRDDPCITPSLSSGIARTIIGRSLAHAHAQHPRLGGAEQKEASAAMNRGSLVHAFLAGTAEDEIEIGDFATFRGKPAQEWAEKVRALGKIAALKNDVEEALAIAMAVREKSARGTTLDPFDVGGAEVSAFWRRGDAWFRARYDRLVSPENEPSTAWDWKVTSDVGPAAVKRAFRRFGYHHQAAHYLAGLDVLRPQFARRHSFVFVFVEDAPPYSVRRYCLTPDMLAVATCDISGAHDAWERAMKTNVWPDASSAKTAFIEIPTFDEEEPDEISTN